MEDYTVSEAGFVEAYRGLLEDLGEEEVLRLSEGVFGSPSRSAVFLHLCRRGASTTRLLMEELMLPEATAHRAVKQLRLLNLVEEALKVSVKGSRGGPRTAVWALVGVPPEGVARALRRHRELHRE